MVDVELKEKTMSSGDGRQLLENEPVVGARTELTAVSDKALVQEKKQPAGTVERVLNFQERSLLIFGCKLYCAKQENKCDHKDQAKLSKLTTLLSYDETVEYFDMIDGSLEDLGFKWQRAKNDWLIFQLYRSGGITADEAKNKSSTLDLTNPPEKPIRRQPEAAPEEIRGKERSFYLPSKLDVWVQDVLRKVNWPNPEKAQYITELCEKFGIKSDES
jgi:hypothetical protein